MAEYVYIEETGVILPDTSETLATVEEEFRDALGQELVVDPATPQGRLIATEVSARDNFLRNNAALANQINPNIAGGVFLDAIWALTGGQRIAATQSVARLVTLAGTPTTLVPAGSQARTSTGTIWETLADATLDALGVASVDMRALEFGPVPAPIGAINTVVSGVLGWETVTNPTAAELGRLQESDVASRARRRVTLALQGVALPEAIISALYDVPGVKSLTFRENYKGAPLVIDGVLLVEHSVYAVVDGGSDLDVATALLANKSLGANWNGVTSVDVVEPASGQTYTVLFDRPTLVPIKVRATVKVQGALSDVAASVRAAILAYANGEIDGETGLIVGQSVSPFELAGAVNALTPAVYVQKMEIAKLADPLAVAEIPLTIQELATINVNNIEVVLA
jgi:uncharacterized phage protein gp47/JayE